MTARPPRCDETLRSRRPVAIRAEAAYKKGLELVELSRYEHAVGAYRDAIRLKPDYAAVYTNLGFAFSRLERWEEARLAYEEAVRLAPSDVDAHYDLEWLWPRSVDWKRLSASSARRFDLLPWTHTRTTTWDSL